jgi:leucyl aminopeptidase
MTRFSVLAESVTEVKADALVVNLFQGETKPAGATGAVDKALAGLLSVIIEGERFKGEPAKRVLVAGLGKKEEFNLDAVRRASAAAAKRAKGVEAKRLATIVHGAGVGGLKAEECAQATVEGILLGCYKFVKYKSDGKESPYVNEAVLVEKDEKKIADLRRGLKRGEIFAQSTIYARDLVNEPALVLTPKSLVKEARKVAKEAGFGLKVYGPKEMERMGMGTLLSVARGSDQPPALIQLTYRPKDKAKRKVGLAGKGITFDSGGLNLKPGDSMLNMKDDMSGAAAVLATMRALGKLKPKLEVIAMLAVSENMPGPKASKPGDVVQAYNKKTVEIANTDAEGRLVLADALAFLAETDVEEIVDLATLTGACIIALGNLTPGVMGNDQGLIDKIIKAGADAGERMWQLPLFDEYRELLKSDVADIKNVGGREAGASQGGIFLKEFVGDKRWAHIDIAGPSFAEKEREDCGKGGTGVGVRTLLNYLLEG